jgi:hypothetical protein
VNIEYPGFGRIIVDGVEYDHDIVLEDGAVRPRSKKPSRHLKEGYGHTPLTEAESIPWTRPRLIVGSGHSGMLPIMPGVYAEAEANGVGLDVMPTAQACALLRTLEGDAANAILHVTC